MPPLPGRVGGVSGSVDGNVHLHAGLRAPSWRGNEPDALGLLYADRHDRLHHGRRDGDDQCIASNADDHLVQPGGHRLWHGAERHQLDATSSWTVGGGVGAWQGRSRIPRPRARSWAPATTRRSRSPLRRPTRPITPRPPPRRRSTSCRPRRPSPGPTRQTSSTARHERTSWMPASSWTSAV